MTVPLRPCETMVVPRLCRSPCVTEHRLQTLPNTAGDLYLTATEQRCPGVSEDAAPKRIRRRRCRADLQAINAPGAVPTRRQRAPTFAKSSGFGIGAMPHGAVPGFGKFSRKWLRRGRAKPVYRQRTGKINPRKQARFGLSSSEWNHAVPLASCRLPSPSQTPATGGAVRGWMQVNQT